MKSNQQKIEKNKVEDMTFKKITKDHLWRFRAGFRGDSILKS
ncbi:MAG: hypothetical protein QNK37_22455 [Acidobacteriota bacterium]|nr:hypothetical protein [Acidobacteriota bacterium]